MAALRLYFSHTALRPRSGMIIKLVDIAWQVAFVLQLSDSCFLLVVATSYASIEFTCCAEESRSEASVLAECETFHFHPEFTAEC